MPQSTEIDQARPVGVQTFDGRHLQAVAVPDALRDEVRDVCRRATSIARSRITVDVMPSTS